MNQQHSDRRRMHTENVHLEIAIPVVANVAKTSGAIGLEASVLDLDEGAFTRLTSAAWCGTPGCSGFDDQWGRKLSCPGYGQA